MDKEELKQIYASIHTLRMEGDFAVSVSGVVTVSFQSTPSAWRVTKKASGTLDIPSISIHTLRMEGDDLYPIEYLDADAFQSTPSAWRVTI